MGVQEGLMVAMKWQRVFGRKRLGMARVKKSDDEIKFKGTKFTEIPSCQRTENIFILAAGEVKGDFSFSCRKSNPVRTGDLISRRDLLLTMREINNLRTRFQANASRCQLRNRNIYWRPRSRRIRPEPPRGYQEA